MSISKKAVPVTSALFGTILASLAAGCHGTAHSSGTGGSGTGAGTSGGGTADWNGVCDDYSYCSNGSSGSAGAPGTGVPTGTSAVDPGEYGDLNMCDIAWPCPKLFQSVPEGEIAFHHAPGMGFSEDEECVLVSLRDGRHGIYSYGSETGNASGHSVRNTLLVVGNDRHVTTASWWASGDGDFQTDHFEPAETCTLSDASFFDECLSNSGDSDHDDACMNAQSWWKDCAPHGPQCQ